MIEFYVKKTGQVIKPNAYPNYRISYFIREDGSVWSEDENTYESQPGVIGFEDFISPQPHLDWRVV